MRARLAVGFAAATALVAMGTAGNAATPTLDGKKIKKIEFKGNAGMTERDVDAEAVEDRDECKAPTECLKQEFTFKPAKGVKGDVVLFQVEFTGTGSDIDLAIYDESGADVAGCGAGYGNKEWASIKMADMKVGKKYLVVAYFYRSIPSSAVKATIEFPAKAIKRGPYPSFAPVEDFWGGPLINCG